MSFTRHLHVICMCMYFTYVYAYAIRMSVVCTRMSSVCHWYVLVCNDMPLVCTRISSVCNSYVLVCHPLVIRMYLYVIRMSLVCIRMQWYVIRMSPVCDFTMNPLHQSWKNHSNLFCFNISIISHMLIASSFQYIEC